MDLADDREPNGGPTGAQPLRAGPRPLPLHLAAATGAWTSSKLGLAHLKNGSIGWRPALRPDAESLRRSLDQVNPEAFDAALDREILGRLDELAAGIARYRCHPYRRRIKEPASVAEMGSTRLLHYPPNRAPGRALARPAGAADTVRTGTGCGPLLLVPSLINRAYILDLAPRRSFARWLAGQGFDTFLVDWGWPGELERGFTLTDYVTGRLAPMLDQVIARSAEQPVVIGYCMGGLLALALALRRQQDLKGLALLATPWDFHASDHPDDLSCWADCMTPLSVLLEPVLSTLGVLPVDLIQALFASRDPLSAARKFRAFAALDPSSPRARDFVALEDWLNDGVPLVAPVARECLAGWYGQNQPARGGWQIAGEPVDPARLTGPVLCMVPSRDRIVPPSSAAALAEAVPGADRLTPPVGHIGMMASKAADAAVWRPLAKWILERCRSELS